VRRILSLAREEGRVYGNFAIFYRTNAQSRSFEEELLKYATPYVVVGGVRFYDRAEVKDALAYLRLLLNPADGAALRRIVNKPARGIGRTTLQRAEALAEERGTSLLEGLRGLAGEEGTLRTAASVRRFFDLLGALGAEIAAASVADAIALVLDRTGYVAALEKEGTPEAETRRENLRELLTAADDFDHDEVGNEANDRSEIECFLEQVALVSDIDSYDRREDCVSLMTAHMAKGLEFPVVFVVGLEEGIFPHSGSMRDERGVEEERRLCYVAMTRAMERLTLTSAEERRRFGSRNYCVASRFLSEIPRSVLAGPPPEPAAPIPGDSSLDYSYGQDEAPELAPGLRVRHPIFGPGTVLAVTGTGPGQKLRIRFERAGVKTIVLRFANLELG
jgi:DNA helicase-2/ATP-dependent DNA helicase PcrA